MKTSLFCLVILSLIWVRTLSAQTRSLEFFLYDSENSTLTEQAMNYGIAPSPNWLLNIKTNSSFETRTGFNQNTRINKLTLNLSRYQKWLQHDFESGFEYYYDKSDLQTELLPYLDRSVFYGYGLSFSPVDSISIFSSIKYFSRQEKDRYINDRHLESDGSQYGFGTVLSYESPYGFFRSGLDHERKHLDWEYYRASSVNSNLSYADHEFEYSVNYNYKDRKDDLYIQTQAVDRSYYQFSDTQNHSSHNVSIVMNYYPASNFQMTASEQYYQKKIRLKQSRIKDNADFNNLASIQINYQPYPSLSFENRFRHSYDIKDFSYNKNSRHTETRGQYSGLAWEYSRHDTLQTSYQIELQRTMYPNDNNRWDNDLLSQYIRIGWTSYYRNRLRFDNWMMWTQKNDRYIKSELSANNNELQSLSLEPEMRVLLGDRLLFSNSYILRADYTRFQFTNYKKNNFYRQVRCRYALLFDSYPYIARSGDPNWLLLPYRSPRPTAFSAESYLEFEQGEYGEQEASYYLISTKNRKLSCGLNLKHDIQDLYYTIQPRYSWGTLYSAEWREYSMLIGSAWNVSPSSLVELSVNPTGESIRNLDWRISLSISIQLR